MKKENNMRITIMPRHAPGFTLVELIVTLAVGGILLAIAIPNYQSFVSNSRISAQSNDFLSAFQLARSEAVKRGGAVSVCKSADSATCLPIGSGTWAQGWIVFTDFTGVAGTLDGTDALIQAREALTGGSTLVGSANAANFITYLPNGTTSLAIGATGVISLCPPSPPGVVGRDIQITASGRAKVVKPPAAACT